MANIGAVSILMVIFSAALLITVTIILSDSDGEPQASSMAHYKDGQGGDHAIPRTSGSKLYIWIPSCLFGVLVLVVKLHSDNNLEIGKIKSSHNLEVERIKQLSRIEIDQLERNHLNQLTLQESKFQTLVADQQITNHKIHEDYQKTIAAIHQEHLDKTEQLRSKYDEDRKRQQSEKEGLRKTFEDKQQQEAAEHRGNMENLEQRLEQSNKKLIDAKENQKQSTQRLCKENKDAIEKLHAKHCLELQRANTAHESALNEIHQQHNDKLDRLRRELKLSKDKHQKEMKDVEQRHKLEMKETEKRHHSEISRFESQQKERFEALEISHNKTIARLQGICDSDVDRHGKESQMLRSHHEASVTALRSEYEIRIEKLEQAQHKDAEKHAAEEKKIRSDFDKYRDNQEAKVRDMQKAHLISLDGIREANEKKLDIIRREYDVKAQNSAKVYNETLEKYQAENRAGTEQLHKEHDAHIGRLTEQFNAMQQQHETEINRIREILQTSKTGIEKHYERQLKNSQEAVAKLQTKHDRTMEIMNRQHEQRINKINERNDAAIKRVEDNKTTEMDKLRKDQQDVLRSHESWHKNLWEDKRAAEGRVDQVMSNAYHERENIRKVHAHERAQANLEKKLEIEEGKTKLKVRTSNQFNRSTCT